MQEVKKIIAIGPESTGKSTLCSKLAAHYNTVWCPEYAREYLLKNGTNYTFDDLLTIAKGQVVLQEEYEKIATQRWRTTGSKTLAPLLFADTDMHVMKVWCAYVFGKVHPFILEKIAESSADMYLLCNVDQPWVKDELREYPDLKSRKELYEIYKEILLNQHVPWVDISGDYNQRLSIAVTATNALINGN
jgi:NadR type nicotinamide-nucleotide adenylyltransferase